ncbi:hypothetical protein D3C81_1139610 [compost metagenome]
MTIDSATPKKYLTNRGFVLLRDNRPCAQPVVVYRRATTNGAGHFIMFDHDQWFARRGALGLSAIWESPPFPTAEAAFVFAEVEEWGRAELEAGRWNRG